MSKSEGEFGIYSVSVIVAELTKVAEIAVELTKVAEIAVELTKVAVKKPRPR